MNTIILSLLKMKIKQKLYSLSKLFFFLNKRWMQHDTKRNKYLYFEGGGGQYLYTLKSEFWVVVTLSRRFALHMYILSISFFIILLSHFIKFNNDNHVPHNITYHICFSFFWVYPVSLTETSRYEFSHIINPELAVIQGGTKP